MIFKVFFTECEHEGDLDCCKEDVHEAGGIIIDSHVNYCEEEGMIEVDAKYYDDWLKRFEKTLSYEFSHYVI